MANKSKNRGKKRAEEVKPVARPRLSLDQILVYAVAFTLFAIPLFILPKITEYGYGKTMAALVAISALSILWGLSAWQKKEWKLRVPWMTFPFLGFVVVALLSLVAAINGRVVIQSLVLVIFFFQLALIIANVVREKRDVTLLLASVLASAFFASFYGLLQHLGVMSGAAGATGINRIISTMGNRNFLGGFLSYLLFPSVVLVLRPRSRIVRVAALGLIAFNFGTLMLVEQLAPTVGLISAAIALIVGIAIFRPIEPIRRNRAWLVGLLALLALTFMIEAPSGPLNSVVGLSQDERGWIGRIWDRNSGQTRELDWWIGFEMLKAHPLTGIGLGNYKLAFLGSKADFLATPRGSAYADLQVSRAAQAHNDYVQAAAELGGLGILAVIGFLGVLAWSVWRRLRRNADEADRLDILLFTAGLIVFLVHALVSFPSHLPVSTMMIVLLLGLIHSRAYGEASTITVRLRKPALAVSLAAITIVGFVVSAFAISDLVANVLVGEGITELQVGELSEAKTTLERSIALDFAPRQAYYYLATALVKAGDLEEALAAYEKCFTRFVDENVYVVFADIATSLDRLEEARQAIDFVLATGPKAEIEHRARYIRATIAIRLGDLSGATRLLEVLISDAPNFELPMIALGNLYHRRGMLGLARDFYERSLVLIDQKLADVEAEIVGRTQFTAEEYGALAQSRATLQSERSFVIEQLAGLPAG